MNILQLLKLTNGILSQNGIEHALIGGLALGAYGVERFTNDVDLLIEEKDSEKATQQLKSVGFDVYNKTDDLIQFHGVGRLDILLARRPLSRQMLVDAQLIPGLGLKCLRAEDIIGLKIQAYCDDKRRRHKDLADIQALLSANKLDLVRVKVYADIFSEWKTIEELLQK